jgi:cephalosporin hydroxylase
MGESNCLFVSRAVLQQVGAVDEAFSLPGGEFANLDLFERLGATPGLTVVTILGEGSFHQVHGGTTTNTDDTVERRRQIWAYRGHYEEVRAKEFRPAAKEMHYVGHIQRGSARTRPRRRVAPALLKAGIVSDPDAFPVAPALIPEDLKLEFTDAYWRSLGWHDTSWLGTPVRKSPADLFAYQELVTRLRPDWIIETRAGEPPLAPFFASLCDQLGAGRVLTICGDETARPPDHPRVETIDGAPLDETVLRAVEERVGTSPNALVVLGSRASAAQTMGEFAAYSRLVPVDGYVVVEDTIVGGHPVWPGFGPGPGGAVMTILGGNTDFAPDLSLERFGPTFNRGGYLRRVSG